MYLPRNKKSNQPRASATKAQNAEPKSSAPPAKDQPASDVTRKEHVAELMRGFQQNVTNVILARPENSLNTEDRVERLEKPEVRVEVIRESDTEQRAQRKKSQARYYAVYVPKALELKRKREAIEASKHKAAIRREKPTRASSKLVDAKSRFVDALRRVRVLVLGKKGGAKNANEKKGDAERQKPKRSSQHISARTLASQYHHPSRHKRREKVREPPRKRRRVHSEKTPVTEEGQELQEELPNDGSKLRQGEGAVQRRTKRAKSTGKPAKAASKQRKKSGHRDVTRVPSAFRKTRSRSGKVAVANSESSIDQTGAATEDVPQVKLEQDPTITPTAQMNESGAVGDKIRAIESRLSSARSGASASSVHVTGSDAEVSVSGTNVAASTVKAAHSPTRVESVRPHEVSSPLVAVHDSPLKTKEKSKSDEKVDKSQKMSSGAKKKPPLTPPKPKKSLDSNQLHVGKPRLGFVQSDLDRPGGHQQERSPRSPNLGEETYERDVGEVHSTSVLPRMTSLEQKPEERKPRRKMSIHEDDSWIQAEKQNYSQKPSTSPKRSPRSPKSPKTSPRSTKPSKTERSSPKNIQARSPRSPLTKHSRRSSTSPKGSPDTKSKQKPEKPARSPRSSLSPSPRSPRSEEHAPDKRQELSKLIKDLRSDLEGMLSVVNRRTGSGSDYKSAVSKQTILEQRESGLLSGSTSSTHSILSSYEMFSEAYRAANARGGSLTGLTYAQEKRMRRKRSPVNVDASHTRSSQLRRSASGVRFDEGTLFSLKADRAKSQSPPARMPQKRAPRRQLVSADAVREARRPVPTAKVQSFRSEEEARRAFARNNAKRAAAARADADSPSFTASRSPEVRSPLASGATSRRRLAGSRLSMADDRSVFEKRQLRSPSAKSPDSPKPRPSPKRDVTTQPVTHKRPKSRSASPRRPESPLRTKESSSSSSGSGLQRTRRRPSSTGVVETRSRGSDVRLATSSSNERFMTSWWMRKSIDAPVSGAGASQVRGRDGRPKRTHLNSQETETERKEGSAKGGDTQTRAVALPAPHDPLPAGASSRTRLQPLLPRRLRSGQEVAARIDISSHALFSRWRNFLGNEKVYFTLSIHVLYVF